MNDRIALRIALSSAAFIGTYNFIIRILRLLSFSFFGVEINTNTWIQYILFVGGRGFVLSMILGIALAFFYLKLRVVREWDNLEMMPEDTEDDRKARDRQKNQIRKNIVNFSWLITFGGVLSMYDFILRALSLVQWRW
jgi:MFS superfamily sulfate permease-like transporter